MALLVTLLHSLVPCPALADISRYTGSPCGQYAGLVRPCGIQVSLFNSGEVEGQEEGQEEGGEEEGQEEGEEAESANADRSADELNVRCAVVNINRPGRPHPFQPEGIADASPPSLHPRPDLAAWHGHTTSATSGTSKLKRLCNRSGVKVGAWPPVSPGVAEVRDTSHLVAEPWKLALLICNNMRLVAATGIVFVELGGGGQFCSACL